MSSISINRTGGKTIGLIGIGLVGTALAERLLLAGRTVIGFDIDPARVDALERLGGTAAPDAAEVVRRSHCIVLALLAPESTMHVVESMLPLLRPGDIVIDAGTGDPQTSAGLADRVRTTGAELIDAPLSGSSAAIRNGDGVAMLGGSETAIAACAELWPLIAAKHIHAGPAGSGQRAKLATNLILGLNRAALAEGLAFAEGLGLDPAAFIELVRATPAYSRAVDAKARRMLERDYDPESRITQHRKDVALMLAAAVDFGIALPLTLAHAAQLDAAIAAGDGARDNAAIVEVWRRSRS